MVNSLANRMAVKVTPQGSNLPQAVRVLTCAAKSGFSLDRVKTVHRSESPGSSTKWTDHFVDEVKLGIHACRVMFVFRSSVMLSSSC